MRQTLADEVGEYLDMPHIRLRGNIALALGQLAGTERWVASGLVSAQKSKIPTMLRRRLIDSADAIVVMPSLPEHFVAPDEDIEDSPEALRRYYGSIKAAHMIVEDAMPREVVTLDTNNRADWVPTVLRLHMHAA